MKQLLKAEDIAKRLRLSKQTVWRLGREGKLETYKVGRTVRFVWEGDKEC